MGKPLNYPRPDLSGLRNRQIDISPYRGAVEGQLYEWVSDVVQRTKQPPTDDGVKPELYLMSSAQESINVLMQASALTKNMSMSLGRSPTGKQTVHADFHWLRRADGSWVIDQVCFALAADTAVNNLARQVAEKQALQEKAELRHDSHINLRKAAFPVEDMRVDDFRQNLEFGDFLITGAIERAHDYAKEDAKMLENPVTPVDMALDLAGMGAGHLAETTYARAARLDKSVGASIKELGQEERFLYEGYTMPQILQGEKLEGAKKLAETFEKTSHLKDIAEFGKMTGEKEKSIGDKLLTAGLDLASFLPTGSPLVKTIAGMMFDIAIASDASRVTKLRSRCYIYFVAGYIKQLTLTDTGSPPRKLDQKYFSLGASTAPKPGSPGSLRTQLALIHYASEHYTDGGWGGLGYKRQNWHFPDQYIVKWSPELLGRALATQLHKRKYLIE